MKFWRLFCRRDDEIDALIKAKGVNAAGARPRYVGLDEPLRQQTEQRRRDAAAMKVRAQQLETKDDQRARLQRVR